MRRLSDVLYRLVVVFWVGSLWAVGYLVVPVLFASVGDRQLAGQIAGRLFEWMGWIGFGCAACLLGYLRMRCGCRLWACRAAWLVVLMVLMAGVNQFAIQPLMVQLKADAWPNDVMASVFRDRFALWHGVSSILYLTQSLLGAGLVLWRDREPE